MSNLRKILTETVQQLSEIGEGTSTVLPLRIRKFKGGYNSWFEVPTADGTPATAYVVEASPEPLHENYIDLLSAFIYPDDEENQMRCSQYITSLQPGQAGSYSITFQTELGGYRMTNKGQLFSVMATVVDFVKKVVALEKSRKLLIFKYVGAAKNREEMPGNDTQRAKLYMQYVKKHIAGTGFRCEEFDNAVYLIRTNF